MSAAQSNEESQERGNQREGEPPGESVLSIVLSLGLLVLTVFAFKQSILDANNIPSGSMIPTLLIGDYLFVNKMRYSFRVPWTRIRLFDYDDPKRGDIVTFEPPGRGSKDYVKRVIGMPGDRIRMKNVPACQLHRYNGRKLNRAQRDRLALEWGFSCSGTDRREPYVVLVEYKAHDKGPWRSFLPELTAARETRPLLLDADDPDMLRPEQRPRGLMAPELPVVFRARIAGREHFFVETPQQSYTDDRICSQMGNDEGCIIPPHRYLVMGDNRDHSRDSRMIGTIPRADIRGKVLIAYFSINWRDLICRKVVQEPGQHFKLKDFPPKAQDRLCARGGRDGRGGDGNQDGERIGEYLRRTVAYRIRRMRVRWGRVFSLPR